MKIESLGATYGSAISRILRKDGLLLVPIDIRIQSEDGRPTRFLHDQTELASIFGVVDWSPSLAFLTAGL